MENNTFPATLPTIDHNNGIFNSFSSHILDYNMAYGPFFSTAQGDSYNNLYYTNYGVMPTCETPISLTAMQVGSDLVDYSCRDAPSLANLPSSTAGLQENLCSVVNMPSSLQSNRRVPVTHGYIGGSFATGWNADNPTYGPRNELSLSLGSCQPSVIAMSNIPDHCSENSCSGVTQVTPKDRSCVLQSWQQERALTNSDDLSLCCGRSSGVPFSNILFGSRYLHAAQQILAEVAGYALGNSAEVVTSFSRIEGDVGMSSSFGCFGEGRDEFLSYGEVRSWESKEEKTRLLTMLQMINHRYNQCVDKIRSVATAFHESTNSVIPQMCTRFALHTISAAYKNLRERITTRVLLATGKECGRNCMSEKESTFESSFIQRKWALQQMERNNHYSWRPQRGLPERSVSVLRAWMFQNFLHPYPKDNDKHLLAIRSGLTRDQVSNWFINARVRLWKPMIEDMYCDIMKKNQTKVVEGDSNRGLRTSR